ncbi:hypothetical protein WN48_08451 [Eufriesea mexicana]|uniref:DUF4802 domain-containing protein n=1 Tax=Eufriesea mexicana TaxID=516756 RepID=A0A310SG34_9HYME|nr:hypothetical protein WN48_08451 [Eufriesea mexicana]
MEKKHFEKEGEKESDTEQEDENAEEVEEHNASGQDIQRPMSQLQLTADNSSNLKSPKFDSNNLMTRMEHAAEVQKYEAGKNAGNDASGEDNRTKAPKILHKSSKELYRAVAKQWGITCKMSDHCRCLDCQSCYFDCEYDKNEHQKTDGGLGAGTPMFISEVMQGSGCVLL